MLTDLPTNWRQSADPLMAMLGQIGGKAMPTSPERIAQGVYLTHLNFGNEIKMLLKGRDPWGQSYGIDGPDTFGVCDNYHQILGRWPEIETMERKLLIGLAPIVRADQPESGGWRWHKWGEYIGNYKPQHEYLYDETIDVVYPFHVYELD